VATAQATRPENAMVAKANSARGHIRRFGASAELAAVRVGAGCEGKPLLLTGEAEVVMAGAAGMADPTGRDTPGVAEGGFVVGATLPPQGVTRSVDPPMEGVGCGRDGSAGIGGTTAARSGDSGRSAARHVPARGVVVGGVTTGGVGWASEPCSGLSLRVPSSMI